MSPPVYDKSHRHVPASPLPLQAINRTTSHHFIKTSSKLILNRCEERYHRHLRLNFFCLPFILPLIPRIPLKKPHIRSWKILKIDSSSD
ncbi:hypothetical protein PtA15_8A41 [Puccinia triticina]|uniref:Uncharacterized protein n=1 Tax=Puccinia triticina TaxID=208348 RepID=A0ABY7CTN9_9BASI|nr:uncharacterized protein PtA15_8A41 [Puccinia triticina]WAQ87140.1 hypothetical protein PtA15_8A41 [Puccinia triticina]